MLKSDVRLEKVCNTQTPNMAHTLAVDFNADLCFPSAPLDVQTLRALAPRCHWHEGRPADPTQQQ